MTHFWRKPRKENYDQKIILKLWLDADSRISKNQNSMKGFAGGFESQQKKESDAAAGCNCCRMADTGEYEVNIGR